MKTVVSTLSRTAVVLFAVCAMSFAPNTDTPGKSAENPTELKYIGSIENRPQFQLSLNNSESDEFSIIIRNRNNEILHKDSIKGANISRKYLLNLEDGDTSGVTFEIVSKKSKARAAYTINETSRLVQDVSITAL